ncbi:hypothetical protein PtB15_18B425 [Puccinia triticina]|nr:hypothetical protein PtB15_18B425 [Puccinia triticina]
MSESTSRPIANGVFVSPEMQQQMQKILSAFLNPSPSAHVPEAVSAKQISKPTGAILELADSDGDKNQSPPHLVSLATGSLQDSNNKCFRNKTIEDQDQPSQSQDKASPKTSSKEPIANQVKLDSPSDNSPINQFPAHTQVYNPTSSELPLIIDVKTYNFTQGGM